MLKTIMDATGLSSVVVWLLVALAAGGALWGYGAYKDHAGYNRGVAFVEAKVDAATSAERTRQSIANQIAIDKARADIEAMRAERDSLDKIMKENDDAADADADRDRVCLGADSVRRIDKVRGSAAGPSGS